MTRIVRWQSDALSRRAQLAVIGHHRSRCGDGVRFPLVHLTSGVQNAGMLDADHCYAAMQRRDPGADGIFFVAVHTTGIYCRPICPARLPLRRNIHFYRTAVEAQEAGFRPCLRCRPESAPDSPAWLGSMSSINRALRLIEEGALAEGNIESLASKLGMTGRHLRRLFAKHIGLNPLAIEQTRRIHLAKKLLHETRLSITDIAFASGFGSLRRFNEVFTTMFGRAPTSLRRNGTQRAASARVLVSIAYRPPLHWPAGPLPHWPLDSEVEAGSVRFYLPFGRDQIPIEVRPADGYCQDPSTVWQGQDRS
jgi:methylphosphotriester-DNA--protein-cysteine methyltransferase